MRASPRFLEISTLNESGSLREWVLVTGLFGNSLKVIFYIYESCRRPHNVMILMPTLGG